MYINKIQTLFALSTFTVLINWNSPNLAATLTGTIDFGNQPLFPSGEWTVDVDIKAESGKITNRAGIMETVVDVPMPNYDPIHIRTEDVTERIWNWLFFEDGSVIIQDNSDPSQIIREVDGNNTNISFNPHPVPEPTTTLSLLSLGILGAGATLKRKLKPSNSIAKETTKVG